MKLLHMKAINIILQKHKLN